MSLPSLKLNRAVTTTLASVETFAQFKTHEISYSRVLRMKVELSPGRLCLLLFVTLFPLFLPAIAAPPPSYIVSKPESSLSRPIRAVGSTPDPGFQITRTDPYIHSFVVHSDIRFRYSRTRVQSVIVNPMTRSYEATFNITLPEKAFISKFSM